MRFVVVLAILCSSLTAAAEDDGLDVPGADSLELRGDALVWEDTAFFLEPWEGGASIRFSSFSRSRRDETGRAIAVKIVAATLRDFVEIELVQQETCTWRRVTPDERLDALRLFVRRDDLAPVLVKPYSVSFSDGTGAKLMPGVPVTPTASGAYVFSARGDRLRLPIPHASVGYVYPRARVDEPELPKGKIYRLDRVHSVRFGDDTFDARAGWLATKPAKHGDTVNLTWTTRCIELVVGVPAASLRESTRPIKRDRLVGASIVPRQLNSIPPGVALSTLSGRAVAVAAQPIEIGPPSGGRGCFDARFVMWRLEDRPTGQITRTHRLCAPQAMLDGPLPAVRAAAPLADDPTAAPPDVAQPPRHARRTASGVAWKLLRPGTGGRKPAASDTVVVHYTGWTTDGKMIDSSIARGQPARFPLRTLIPGWTEGLQIMSIGDKARLWIPEELAYKGVPNRPTGMLVFDVELLGID